VAAFVVPTRRLTIELEITGSGEHRRLLGQLIPRQSAVVDIRHGEGVITVEADTLGRFSTGEVPSGQISLRCRLGSSQFPILTRLDHPLSSPEGLPDPIPDSGPGVCRVAGTAGYAEL
jgi:hypothetical protein